MISKFDTLRAILQVHGKVAVAFSGGLDSSVLLAYAAHVLGPEHCLALTAVAPYMMAEEIVEADSLCRKLKVEHLKLKLGIPEDVRDNPPDRCYLCKKSVFTQLREAAERSGFSYLVDGTNVDDESDYRPGMKALSELGVFSPLREAGMTKRDIRELGESLGMDEVLLAKPAYACLLTRLEHGRKFSVQDLRRVDRAEEYLRQKGYKKCRVRVHGELARLELDAQDWPGFFAAGDATDTDDYLKSLGYRYVALDLKGYSRGSMNVRMT